MIYNSILADSDICGTHDEEFKSWLGHSRLTMLENAVEKEIYSNPYTLDVSIFKDLWELILDNLSLKYDETMFRIFIEYIILFYSELNTDTLAELYHVYLEDESLAKQIAVEISTLYHELYRKLETTINIELEPLPYHWIDGLNKLIILRENIDE